MHPKEGNPHEKIVLVYRSEINHKLTDTKNNHVEEVNWIAEAGGTTSTSTQKKHMEENQVKLQEMN